jgi:large subunit ribosomal protein L4e
MVKATIYSVNGEKTGQLELPMQFSEPVRFDLIKRAIFSIQSRNRQPYGADPLAGTKQGNATSKRRQRYKTTYGRGVSRIKRKYSFHRGRQFGWIGAFVANAVSGRKAFPPKAEKIIIERINKKESKKAIRSALAANVQTIKVIDNKVMNFKKTQEVQKSLEKLGLGEELAKSKDKTIRAGKGSVRGRKYRVRRGPLFVYSNETPAVRSARNIPGVDVSDVKKLNAEILCPGNKPRRASLFTKEAIEMIKKEGLYL